MGVKEGKRGQLTIFIILAILIVALALLIYFFYPKLKGTPTLENDNPYSYIQTCMQERIEETITTISKQGGDYLVNEQGLGFFFYRGDYIKFLCYTNEDFAPCVNQQPFLTEHIEEEIREVIESESENCFNSLIETYEDRGYNVDYKKGDLDVQILPEAVVIKHNSEVVVTKGNDKQDYEDFDIKLTSSMYEILEVVNNIIIWEINVGDAISEAYMSINPYLKVEKKKKEQDVKIYIITNRNTGEVFKFATRSYAAPVGF